VVDAATVVATHLSEVIKANAHELLGRQELQGLLDNISRTHPKVVEELIPNILPTGVVLKVLKNLLKERVSIRNLLTILETLADYGMVTKDPDILTEYVRQSLMRTICQSYAKDNEIQVLALDPRLEALISDSVQHTEHGSYLALDLDRTQSLLLSINKEVERLSKQGVVPILLTSPVIRIYLKRLIERYMPDLVILSHNEIPPEVTIKTLGMVKINAD